MGPVKLLEWSDQTSRLIEIYRWSCRREDVKNTSTDRAFSLLLLLLLLFLLLPSPRHEWQSASNFKKLNNSTASLRRQSLHISTYQLHSGFLRIFCGLFYGISRYLFFSFSGPRLLCRLSRKYRATSIRINSTIVQVLAIRIWNELLRGLSYDSWRRSWRKSFRESKR